jgi:hypothetical protein
MAVSPVVLLGAMNQNIPLCDELYKEKITEVAKKLPTGGINGY